MTADGHAKERPSAGLSGEEFDVVVVGAGPTGLALATLLAGAGTRVAVVDPNRIPCQHPRATHIDDETMRILQTLGAADEASFLRHEGHEIQSEKGATLVSLLMNGPRTDQGWWSDYQFHQPDFEAKLRGRLIDEATASLWLGWTAVDLRQDAETVQLTVRDSRSGEERQLTGRYLVGADGAGSWVRRALGLEVGDLRGSQTSVIVDVHPFERSEILDPSHSFIRSSAGWPITYVPVGPPRLRFERMLRPDDDPEDHVQPHVVYDMLRPWLKPNTYRIMRTDVYEWHSHLAERWRSGRAFVAGDAAHTMPPMLGQGMCSGLRDAANLAWKLTAVVAGTSPDSLLDTYQTERYAHVRPLIEESARQANLIESTDYVPAEDDGPTEPQVIVMSQARPPLGPGLLDETQAATAVLAPQPAGDDGKRFDEQVGYRFALYANQRLVDQVSERTRQAWKDLDLVVVSSPSRERDQWLSSRGCDALLVRPDRYVFAPTCGPAELTTATDNLLDRLRAVGVR